jgi:alpha-L-rhamnosidase
MRNFALLFLIAAAPGWAQNPELLTGRWSARWITIPGASPYDYGVYHFRRSFELPSKPASFRIHVTGDNRYQLFVNGERVAWGPARGDLYHWRYETVDIAPQLKAGRNVLAAVVWNLGQHAPVAQVTNQTGFLLQGDTRAERIVDTGGEWKCAANTAYRPVPVTQKEVPGYYAVGSGEHVNGAAYPWGWEQPGYDDSFWKPAHALSNGAARDSQDAPNRWMLVPRSIPMMEEKPERLLKVRKVDGVKVPEGFPARPAAIRIAPNTRATLLLDQTYLTTGYPELVVSGGKGASVSLRYAEALFLPDRRGKGNRNEVDGKVFLGNQDVYLPDGGSKRVYRPLWWRTYRYVELKVETQAQAATIDDLRGVYTGYPFQRKARLDAPSAELQAILNTGWRTARLCAHESYMDCPYYEQLQYAGDTRIQALVSLYMTGDGRLMRNAIEQLNSSRTAEGATYSRAPSQLQQYIPPFSLWWIGMVHDYWMYQDDESFVREMLPGVRAVLQYFAARQKPNGSLGRVPWWSFVDWTKQWPNGVPPADEDGSSAPLDLQLLLGYQWAARMEAALGSKALAGEYEAAAERLANTVRLLYFDAGRGIFADTPRKQDFSQHSTVLAILAGVSQGEEARKAFDRVTSDASLTQCSIYFRYYLHRALSAAGYGDRYLESLAEWRDMLARGLSTWAEQADPTRSDCHAWGASPNIELFRTVLGIDSSAPGFRRVLIRPALGKLDRASGAIPHPKGEIVVNLAFKQGSLQAEVTLPEGVTGECVWRGERKPLASGVSKLVF